MVAPQRYETQKTDRAKERDRDLGLQNGESEGREEEMFVKQWLPFHADKSLR